MDFIFPFVFVKTGLSQKLHPSKDHNIVKSYIQENRRDEQKKKTKKKNVNLALQMNF